MDGEISTTSMLCQGYGSDGAERGTRAEADHQRAVVLGHEQRRVVSEEALGVHLPAVVALEFPVRVEREHVVALRVTVVTPPCTSSSIIMISVRGLVSVEIHVGAAGEIAPGPSVGSRSRPGRRWRRPRRPTSARARARDQRRDEPCQREDRGARAEHALRAERRERQVASQSEPTTAPMVLIAVSRPTRRPTAA